MSDTFQDQQLLGMIQDGRWVELARWSSTNAEYDAPGWLDQHGDRIGSGNARLPTGGWVDLSAFLAIRGAMLTP